jgi:hypothetical protein
MNQNLNISFEQKNQKIYKYTKLQTLARHLKLKQFLSELSNPFDKFHHLGKMNMIKNKNRFLTNIRIKIFKVEFSIEPECFEQNPDRLKSLKTPQLQFP